MKLEDAARHLRTVAQQAEAHVQISEAAETVLAAHKGLKDVEARQRGVQAVVAELIRERDELHENVRAAEVEGRSAVAEVEVETKTRITKLKNEADILATELSERAAESRKLLKKLEREHNEALQVMENQRAVATKALKGVGDKLAAVQAGLT